ncbi:hypothetical protein ScalyP_jg6125 [Parmales sp. scaly parma]|nr:hypothetical protein ScalyP_jg6125 [Parmales sp. scaly parma]
MEITQASLRVLIDKDKLYRTPELNDKLFLHYKGFRKIQNLELYTGLKVLWLEGNGLDKIENLTGQSLLRTLYLHENVISKIENLEPCPLLDTINLSKNFIKKIENVSHLTKLTTLNLANNNLTSCESIEAVRTLPMLNALDIQSNAIDGGKEDADRLIAILASCPSLKVVYLKGNEIVKKIAHYRKTMISRCRQLRYLDDRPVFDEERRRCNKWGQVMAETGGDVEAATVAERAEIVTMRQEKKNKEDRAFSQFEAMVREGQAIKAERERQEAEENGGILPQKTFVSTDHKTFGADGGMADEKKVEKDFGVGSHILKVDRSKNKTGTNPFSGERILDVKESRLIADAREERWGLAGKKHQGKHRVLSQNIPKTNELPIPPTAEQVGNMTSEAKEEEEIEEYYTKTANNDNCNFESERNANGGEVNAAASMDVKMAAELATLQIEQARQTEKRILEAEKDAHSKSSFEFGAPLMPPAPPGNNINEKSVLEQKRTKQSQKNIGIGGTWPKRIATTDLEELD